MIINEKGLARALRLAYKRTGYTLMHSDDQVTVYTEDWYVRADREKFPIKALATIVEHMGGLPTSADALLIMNGEAPQVAMPEIVGSEVAAWVNGEKTKTVTMVPVIVRGLQLYQEEDGGACYGVAMHALGIVERDVATHKDATAVEETRLEWSHDGEDVIIAAARPTAAYWAKDPEKEVWAALEGVDLHKREE